ncbi:MAG: hypothetical protein ABIG61_07250 [Planctomycetota bacterium]
MVAKSEQPYSDSEVALIRKECRESLYYFGKELLSYNDSEIEPHERMCRFLDSDTPNPKMLVGSRGIFKTSFGTVARAMQIVLRDPNARVLIVQSTAANAEIRMMEIKTHFEQNKRVIQIFGEQIPEVKGKTTWSKKAVTLHRPGIYGEASITAAGIETQLAGQHFSHILMDDIVAADKSDMKEHDIIIISPEEIAKAIGWIKLTMHGLQINTTNPNKQTKIQYVGNRWAIEDVVAHLTANHLKSEDNPHGFEFLEMAAHKPDGSLLWPGGLSEKRLAQIRKAQNDFIYMTQYECEPYNPGDLTFPVDNNQYWQGLYPPLYNTGEKRYRIMMLMDMADVKNAASCYTAAVILWIDEDNHIWVGEAIEEKLNPSEKIELIHKMVRKYSLRNIHIEENLNNEILKYTLRDAMHKAGLRYYVQPLKHKNRNKDARIVRLQPWHNKGALHIKYDQLRLRKEMQHFPFPYGKKDVLDALGYAMDFVHGPAKTIKREEPDYSVPNTFTHKDIKASIKKHRTLVYGQLNSGPFHKQGRRRRIDRLDRIAI